MAQQGMTDLDSKSWRAFHRIGSRLLPHLSRRIAAHSDISSAEYVVLVALYEAAGKSITIERLASALGWETSRMSHQVTRMHSQGLISKVQSTRDARCFELSITPAGEKIAKLAIPRQSIEINHCFSDVLTNEQKQALIEIASAIDAHMRVHHPLHKKEEAL